MATNSEPHSYKLQVRENKDKYDNRNEERKILLANLETVSLDAGGHEMLQQLKNLGIEVNSKGMSSEDIRQNVLTTIANLKDQINGVVRVSHTA